MSIPYVPRGTNRRFFVPRTLAADFDAFLEQDIPNMVMDFELLKSWYDREKTGYIPSYIRGEIYPDSTKSRYENTDNNMNFRASITSGIRKGDMLVEPDGSVYLLDWEVHLESNNAPSRALRCNMMLEVKRHEEAEVDEDGYVVHSGRITHDDEEFPSGNWKTIVAPIPCNSYRYDGRPEAVAVSSTPGLIVNALTELTVQYNEQTKNIKIGDVFTWGNEDYEIIDINRVGMNIRGEYGTLRLQSKKKAGGMNGY